MKREIFRIGKRWQCSVHITQDDEHGVISLTINDGQQVVYLNGFEAADLRNVLQQAMSAPQQGGAA